MDKRTILERLKIWIATIGWNLFIWGNDFTEEEYWQRIYEQEKAYLKTSEAKADTSISGLPIPIVGGSYPTVNDVWSVARTDDMLTFRKWYNKHFG